MTDAMSRLTDVDMAEEMTNYTHQNVLNQAAISVLTQANDLPQQVLQILQKQTVQTPIRQRHLRI